MSDAMHDMPLSHDLLTREQLDAWLASRETAGREIDVETCELGFWFAFDGDPYGVGDPPPEQDGNNLYYVRSKTSGGWICETDLPAEKVSAIRDRIHARSKKLLDIRSDWC